MGRSYHVAGMICQAVQIYSFTVGKGRNPGASHWPERVHLMKSQLARRIFFPPKVDALLHYNGFTVVERYGDWDRSLLTNESPRMIFVAKKR